MSTPRITPSAIESLDILLDPEDADKWNTSIAVGSFPCDLDKEIFETAKEQVEKGLLSKAMSKGQVDKAFGKGQWRAIRRRGLRQNDKVRGIDNARASKTNFAAFLQDTIMTTPHDIAIQILTWLFSGKEGASRFEAFKDLLVSLGADDLADAYHGIPNALEQLGLCVVGIMNPELERMEFYISYAHFFGLSAAVVNFNRVPELLTAACRRIGAATTWHFFDDQGVLDFHSQSTSQPTAGGGRQTSRSTTEVPGLVTAKTQVGSANQALAEIAVLFKSSPKKGSSQMIEIGTSFTAWERNWSIEEALPLGSFPKLRALMLGAMVILIGDEEGSRASPEKSSLNIICRKYSRGQGIPKHADREGEFGFSEDVFGCIQKRFRSSLGIRWPELRLQDQRVTGRMPPPNKYQPSGDTQSALRLPTDLGQSKPARLRRGELGLISLSLCLAPVISISRPWTSPLKGSRHKPSLLVYTSWSAFLSRIRSTWPRRRASSTWASSMTFPISRAGSSA